MKMSFDFNTIKGGVACDIETSGLGSDAEIISVALAWKGDNGEIESLCYFIDRYCQVDAKVVIENEAILSRILAETFFNSKFNGIFIFHNAIFDMIHLLRRFKPEMKRFEAESVCKISDTLTISRVQKGNKFISHVDPKQRRCHSLKYLAEQFLGNDIPQELLDFSYEEATGGVGIRFADRATLLRYNVNDAVLTLLLYYKFKTVLSVLEWKYLEEIEIPHLLNILHLSFHGVPIDDEEVDSTSNEIYERMALLERDITRHIGRPINLNSLQDVAGAIFYNPALTYSKDGGLTKLRLEPLYYTDHNQIKIDIDTLKSISEAVSQYDRQSNIPTVLIMVVRYMELSKAYSALERLSAYSVQEGTEAKIYPNVSATTVSGRTSYSRPNLLGLGKSIYKKGSLTEVDNVLSQNPSLVPGSLDRKSIRNSIRAKEGYGIISSDINGLDLAIIADGAIKSSGNLGFFWLDFINRQFGEIVDSHFALLSRIAPELYCDAFRSLGDLYGFNPLDFWAKKPTTENGKKGITFIRKNDGSKMRTEFPEDEGRTERALEEIRNVSKKLNLSTSYLAGASGLAVNLSEATGRKVSILEAQSLLDRFYDFRVGFPEIRQFQDKIANEVYHAGHSLTPFGRKFYADCWDDLNEKNASSSCQGEYEFVLVLKNRYWYIKVRNWVKDSEDVISDLKYVDRKFGVKFKDILSFQEIDSWIFRKRALDLFEEKNKKKKSEEILEETTDFVLSRAEMTIEIQRAVKLGTSFTSDTNEFITKFLEDGILKIPEKIIFMYRVQLENPSSAYFKPFKPLLRVAKRFFPNYCQGVAATIAKKILTYIRESLEQRTHRATVLLFIHDQFDVVCPLEEQDEVMRILEEAVKIDMSPFELKFTGELKFKGRDFQ